MASSSSDEVLKGVKRNVRAVLLSKIGGVPKADFNKDYKALLGDHFPYRKLGYQTLEQGLNAMPDVVRFEMKNGEEYLFGIADESSFMSSFAIKAQFPEFSEKKKRNRVRNRNGGWGKSSRDNQHRRPHTDVKQNHQERPPCAGDGNQSASKKYPDLVGNMDGLYSVVVNGTTADMSKNVEVLFATIGPVAGRSACGDLLFFRFGNLQHAESVIDTFNGFTMGRYKLRVRPAQEKKRRTNDGQVVTHTSQEITESPRPQQQQKQPHNHQPQRHQDKKKQRGQQQQQHQQQQQQQPGDTESFLEDKISELNTTLLNRMQEPSNNHITVPYGEVLRSMNMVKDDKSEHTPNKQSSHMAKGNSTSQSSINSHQNHDTRHSNPKVGSRGGQRSNNARQQRRMDSDMCSIKVGNIANSLLEKDVMSFLEPYNPERINFKYPAGHHMCYSAVVHLQNADAERAIQCLNGKIKYDTPLSVKPCTMKARKPRQRNQSEGSSVNESVSSSVVTVDDTEPAVVGDSDDEPLPSLADFADRFSNVTI